MIFSFSEKNLLTITSLLFVDNFQSFLDLYIFIGYVTGVENVTYSLLFKYCSKFDLLFKISLKLR